MDILRSLARYSLKPAKQLRRRIFGDEQWFLAVNAGPPLADSIIAGRPPKAKLTVHHAPPGRFWADPFPVVVDSKIWVFFEDYSFAANKAVIACAPVSADGGLGEVITALAPPEHLSYPFIFEHQGQLYMIPDTWDEKRVDLWRCCRFPDDWHRERTLLDVSMSDPTLHRQDGKLWLFGTVCERRARANDELHIYVADALDGAWRPHPANPVVSDRRRARPAGRLLCRGGHLIRPSQDCGKRYGGAVVLNRVDELNEYAYDETPIGAIDGAGLPGNRGTHTVNSAGGIEFLDGRMWSKGGQRRRTRRSRSTPSKRR